MVTFADFQRTELPPRTLMQQLVFRDVQNISRTKVVRVDAAVFIESTCSHIGKNFRRVPELHHGLFNEHAKTTNGYDGVVLRTECYDCGA